MKTYKEFRILPNGDKEQTKRGTVRISDKVAAINNSHSKQTRLVYEELKTRKKKGENK